MEVESASPDQQDVAELNKILYMSRGENVCFTGGSWWVDRCRPTLKETRSTNIQWGKIINKRIPITNWLPKYTPGKAARDVLAGFTVGLTEIPQGIAYAFVAGLDAEYGLYSGFMGCFMYALFGSCKDVNIGPTAIMALMAQPYVQLMGPAGAILMTFLSGSIIFVLGLLHLGFVVEFISYPVVAGFTCAAALNIASTQIKGLLGLKGKANDFLESVIHAFQHIGETRAWDATLGICSIIFLVLMRQLRNFGSMKHNPHWSKTRNIVGIVVWLLSLASNAIVVIFGTLLAYILYTQGQTPFLLIDKVGKGLPSFEPPPFSADVNGTHYDFTDMVKEYGSSMAFIPLVAILESIAIAKAFSKGKAVDATQELIALGICNMMGSFVSSMPVTGSFTRTAVNNASGVKTPLGGVITGALVLLALGFLTSTFTYIPKTTLAAVIMTSMYYLFEFEAFSLLWKAKKIEMIPFLVTFIAALFLGLEYGIVIGIGVNMIFVLYPTARPKINISRVKLAQGDVFVVVPNTNMQFPSAEYFREKVLKECGYYKTTVVIDGSEVNYMDTTVAKNMKELMDDLHFRQQKVVFWNFESKIAAICVSVDNRFAQHCRAGTLEEVVDDPTLDRVSVDIVYSIQ